MVSSKLAAVTQPPTNTKRDPINVWPRPKWLLDIKHWREMITMTSPDIQDDNSSSKFWLSYQTMTWGFHHTQSVWSFVLGRLEIHDWIVVKILNFKHRFQNIEMQRKQNSSIVCGVLWYCIKKTFFMFSADYNHTRSNSHELEKVDYNLHLISPFAPKWSEQVLYLCLMEWERPTRCWDEKEVLFKSLLYFSWIITDFYKL